MLWRAHLAKPVETIANVLDFARVMSLLYAMQPQFIYACLHSPTTIHTYMRTYMHRHPYVYVAMYASPRFPKGLETVLHTAIHNLFSGDRIPKPNVKKLHYRGTVVSNMSATRLRA